uniref:Uncharacterized protein n=1 Tax=Labrus bergylta TaxID=56723 RepID=A0A3Q3H2E8_9LABR
MCHPMMLLNNQVLEAVQKRLEMSLELEAWKTNKHVKKIFREQIANTAFELQTSTLDGLELGQSN